jgi:SAM-dependent methyltransferase
MSYTSISPCPVCGCTKGALLSSIDGKTRQPLIVLQCAECGLGYIDPLPTHEQLQAWYTQGYREDYKNSFQPQMRHVLRAGRMSLDRWAWLRQNGSRLKIKRSLDIGASSGEFVYLLKTCGVDANGLEPHKGYSAHARDKLGSSIRTGTLQDWYDAIIEEEDFDLISMFHVLEHLVDPVASLVQMRSLLNPGGVLYIEVPNSSVMCAPTNVFFRAHTLYFTSNSLFQTMAKAGLSVIAHSSDDDANLRVVAQPTGECSPELYNDDKLAASARVRTWPKYLLTKLTRGQILKKLRKRQEERSTAARFIGSRELLDNIYKNAIQ